MKKILVIGASGVLGKLVCIELLRIFDNQIKLIVTDYKAERGKKLANSLNNNVQFKYLDVNKVENVKRVIENIDIVVVVLKQEVPNVQKICIDNKIICLDVTPFYDFIEKVNELNQSAEMNNVGSIVMSGFFPGLSGLMVQKAVSNFEEVTEINVGLLQNTNAKAGISGILDMLKIISQQVKFENKIISGFTKKRKMYFLNHHKEKEVRLIHHSEKILLKNKLKVNSINYWTSWNVNIFNKLVSLLRRLGFFEIIHKFGNKFLSKIVKHNTNKNENAFLTVEVKGLIGNKEKVKIVSISTFSDYHTTAMVTASLTKIALQKKVKGVVFPFEVLDLEELLSEINCPNIVIEEFEK
ncbi:saccharopine dehydrogenase NADP-binding domain-containing protein [Viridibacillus sp. NPDC093762]|uniref:saccharopine dehydrogenase NADP-binding domain-containing protein n=1 Tax=Viridibacillus sp. NPDC093762 TaxID=3390720 RepID=UPI003D03A751